jgi:hypothetical protein
MTLNKFAAVAAVLAALDAILSAPVLAETPFTFE